MIHKIITADNITFIVIMGVVLLIFVVGCIRHARSVQHFYKTGKFLREPHDDGFIG